MMLATPDVPLEPELPLVPDEPEEPDVPELPLVPELPDVPLEPEEPAHIPFKVNSPSPVKVTLPLCAQKVTHTRKPVIEKGP